MFLKGMWRRAAGLVALSGAVLAVCVGPAARGEELSMEEMRQRLEKVEKMNQELLRRLDGAAPAAPGAAAADDALPTLQNADGMDTSAVKKVVEDYLKATEAKKKKADEEKAKQAELEGFEVGKDLKMSARWNNGLWVETADKAFRVHVGGRTQFDTIWMDAPDNVMFGRNGIGILDDATNFRRARLTVDGTFWEVIDFTCEYDFLNTLNNDPSLPPAKNTVGNTPVPTDLWMQVNRIPYVGNFRIGNQKPPISFEHMTSSRFLNFMERSTSFDAFIEDQDNGFSPGFQIFNWLPNERATWALGAFKTTRSILGWNVGDGEWGVVGRVTGLPYYANDGRCLVHVGLGARYRDPDDKTTRYRSRPELRNGPAVLHNIISQTQFLSSAETLIVPELVAVWGPWTFQSEYYGSWVYDSTFPVTPVAARQNRGTTFWQGYYAEALYFLTGEHRVYDKRYPRFDRVVPYENAFCVRGHDGSWAKGWGAWQVGARYSYLDLQDKNIGLGVVHGFTAGLNWFLNPNAKIQWNYIWEYREVDPQSSAGVIQGFGMTFRFDF